MNKKYSPLLNKKQIPISVIIAVKNGEKNITRLLDALLIQKYNGDMEFIIVDDNSTDNTKNIIDSYVHNDSRVKYISSNTGDELLDHKKRALDAGIQSSQYEYLLFTDVDCIIQSFWVESMASCFAGDFNYIIGLTYINKGAYIINKFQRIDLFMLLSASYASVVLGSPWASSGQNQAYTKSLYNKIGGFKKLSQYLQGDDTLFLQLAISNGANVAFNNQPNSFVISRIENSWKSLLLQRARWAGDANIMWKFNLSFYLLVLSTFTFNVLIGILIFTKYLLIIIPLIICKFYLEITMYKLGAHQFKQSCNYLDFIIWFIIQPLYVSIMGICSFFNFRWKGKSIN